MLILTYSYLSTDDGLGMHIMTVMINLEYKILKQLEAFAFQYRCLYTTSGSSTLKVTMYKMHAVSLTITGESIVLQAHQPGPASGFGSCPFHLAEYH